jgi:hypothetical protein
MAISSARQLPPTMALQLKGWPFSSTIPANFEPDFGGILDEHHVIDSVRLPPAIFAWIGRPAIQAAPRE